MGSSSGLNRDASDLYRSTVRTLFRRLDHALADGRPSFLRPWQPTLTAQLRAVYRFLDPEGVREHAERMERFRKEVPPRLSFESPDPGFDLRAVLKEAEANR